MTRVLATAAVLLAGLLGNACGGAEPVQAEDGTWYIEVENISAIPGTCEQLRGDWPEDGDGQPAPLVVVLIKNVQTSQPNACRPPRPQ